MALTKWRTDLYDVQYPVSYVETQKSPERNRREGQGDPSEYYRLFPSAGGFMTSPRTVPFNLDAKLLSSADDYSRLVKSCTPHCSGSGLTIPNSNGLVPIGRWIPKALRKWPRKCQVANSRAHLFITKTGRNHDLIKTPKYQRES